MSDHSIAPPTSASPSSCPSTTETPTPTVAGADVNVHVHDIQKANWNGSIPIQLSLAPTSLSSPTMPSPSHRLISRQSYLHIALEEDVRIFHEFAPMSISITNFRSTSVDDDDDGDNGGNGNGNGNGDNVSNEKEKDEGTSKDKCDDDDTGDELESKQTKTKTDETKTEREEVDTDKHKSYPVCWFEDEVTGIALRWQIFTGVLFDLMCLKQSQLQHGTHGHTRDTTTKTLPWKIRIHFTSYPATLLPLPSQPSSTGTRTRTRTSTSGSTTSDHNQTTNKDAITQYVFQYYLNSLKQSLYIQHNSNKISKNMSKQSHLQLWDGIIRNQWEVYKDAIETNELNGKDANANAAGQQQQRTIDNMNSVPIRILVDGKPVFTRPCPPYRNVVCSSTTGTADSGGASANGIGGDDDESKHENELEMTTLRHVLQEWLPDLCFRVGSESKSNDEHDTNGRDHGHEAIYLVQGIQIPLECHIADVWRGLCHPDRFLYISVVTKRA